MKQLLNTLIFLIAATFSAHGQASFFDPTFGTGGKTIASSSGSFESIALQADGKIVATGSNNADIWRFNTDGTADMSFGTGGSYLSLVLSNTLMVDVALQPDNKIVVVGTQMLPVSPTGSDIAVLRVDASGSPDMSFGVGGAIVVDVTGFNDDAKSVVLQPDGKILIAGQFSIFSTGILRLNANGSVDSSFGTDGHILASYDDAYYIDVTPDGKIVTGGTSSAPHGYSIAALRFLEDGSFDTSFNHTGASYVFAGAAGSNYGRGVRVQPDGKMLVTGTGDFGSSEGSNFVAVRYNVDGTPDNSFGTAGVANVDFDGANDEARSICVAADGKIYMAGATGPDNGEKVAVACLNNDGTLCASWGASGKIITQWGYISDRGYDAVVQGDGRIVVAGTSFTDLTTMSKKPTIARYTATPVAIQHLSYANDACLFPNPATDRLLIRDDLALSITSISANDIAGKDIPVRWVGDRDIDVKGWPSGLYFVTISFKTGESKSEFVNIKK